MDLFNDPPAEPYRPSNGDEGTWFEGEFCARCAKNWEECPIWAAAQFFDVDDPEYPKEWVYGCNGPTCTAFS